MGNAVGHEDATGHEAVTEVTWHKGRQCDAGTCVEIATAGEEVLLRSTVSPRVRITLTRQEWLEFLAGAKEGRFDHV